MINHFFIGVTRFERIGLVFLVGLSTVLAMAESGNTDPNQTEFDSPIGINPGSITAQFEEDEEWKDSLFRLPLVGRTLEPWYDFKTELSEKDGFKGYGLTVGFDGSIFFMEYTKKAHENSAFLVLIIDRLG